MGVTVQAAEAAGKPLLFVISRVKPRARLTADAAVALSQHGAVAPAFIFDQVDYAAAKIDGQTRTGTGAGWQSGGRGRCPVGIHRKPSGSNRWQSGRRWPTCIPIKGHGAVPERLAPLPAKTATTMTVPLTFRAPVEMHERLRKLAFDTREPIQKIIEQAVSRHLDTMVS